MFDEWTLGNAATTVVTGTPAYAQPEIITIEQVKTHIRTSTLIKQALYKACEELQQQFVQSNKKAQSLEVEIAAWETLLKTLEG